MVKIIRFLCIVGIIILLALFIGFTEFENKKEQKEITETEKQEKKNETLNAELTDDSKANIVIKILTSF